MYTIWAEGVRRRGMLDVKVVVAMRMAAGRVAGMWEAVRAVNKQLAESLMGTVS
jgi:hypothetical protein